MMPRNGLRRSSYSIFKFLLQHILTQCCFQLILVLEHCTFIQFMFICWWDDWRNAFNGEISNTKNTLICSYIGPLWTSLSRFIKFDFNRRCINRVISNRVCFIVVIKLSVTSPHSRIIKSWLLSIIIILLSIILS